ncbi:ABC transporter substrate-binding protein [Streptomyces sp. SP17BM10]|uniref:ABC transporter substrate-binding protein n=1 Tax=Streptomyces sp. SP17BM10 TaxID=3002530 RepID=UPI002E7A613D|nr:ABC transporter substrate-binding protein [Streptomyces sp. SP17BM10]MEE1788426.1 ABC transporter substrate-binding protein [Streptomyces sp. SP17BM10]
MHRTPSPAHCPSVHALPLRAAAVLGAGGLLLTGCGGAADPGAQADLRASLPKAVKAAGVLRIGSYLHYPPVDFRDTDGKPAGLDPEIAAAVGDYLGLRVEFTDLPFEQLIPAVQAKRIDLAMSAVIDTKQRQLGAADDGHQTDPGVDFVDYFTTGTSMVVKAGSQLSLTTVDDLCGHTVAVQRGTLQDEFATRQQSACPRDGKQLKVDRFDSDDQALAEVANGTAVADLNDYPVAQYNTTTPARTGKFEVANTHFLQSGPYGITVAKDDSALRDAVSKALDQVILGGGYDKILAKWNVSTGAVASTVVNGGL